MYVFVKCIVYHKIEGSAHIRDIALEHFVRIDRKLQTVQVQSVVGSKILAHLRVFILFLLACRESQTFEVGKGFCTRSIQHLCTMPANHRLTLREKINILLFCFHAYSPNSFFIQS